MTAGRRQVGWVQGAGSVLALASMVEAVVRTDGSDVTLSVALLLGLCATAPLIFMPGHAAAAAAAITAATPFTAVAYRGVPAVTGLIALLTAWFLLVTRRLRRLRAEAASRGVSREAFEHTLLELTVRGERARIARELHDVVAHHISMISVQAETARLATAGMPAEGAKRLLAIGDTARTALTEMRRLLGVLREDAGGEPTRAPQPGLQQLLELIDETRETSGVSIRLIVSGEVTPLDAGIELTAYRIVQEALTNARRHAPGAAVDVEVEYGVQLIDLGDFLRIRVRDNGPGPSRSGRGRRDGAPGHGLLGMRERAAAVGGELRSGSGSVSGFVVEATLPVRGRESGTGESG